MTRTVPDGNGRTGNILWNWLRGTLGNPEAPPDFWSDDSNHRTVTAADIRRWQMTDRTAYHWGDE